MSLHRQRKCYNVASERSRKSAGLSQGFWTWVFWALRSNIYFQMVAIGLELWRRICQNIAQTRPLSVPFYMRQHLLLSIKLSLISDFHSIQSPLHSLTVSSFSTVSSVHTVLQVGVERNRKANILGCSETY